MSTIQITRLRDSEQDPSLGVYSIAENYQWISEWHAESELHALEQWVDAEYADEKIRHSSIEKTI